MERVVVSIGELLKSNTNIRDDKRESLRNFRSSSCTQYFLLHNKSTKYEVTVGLAQGLDEDGVDSGYNQTTGLVAIGVNLKPNNSSTVDVSGLKVQATKAELSLDCKVIATGEQVPIDLPDRHVPTEYPYMKFAEWELTD